MSIPLELVKKRVDVVVGLQYGDEGKGKIVHFLTSKQNEYVLCIRSTGGPNAGHTVWLDEETKIVTHQVPTGILNGVKSYIARGCYIDPVKLAEEIKTIRSTRFYKIPIEPYNLLISKNCHVIMPEHIKEDSLDKQKIGTTKQGIGPCAIDKYSRKGIRLIDLIGVNKNGSINKILLKKLLANVSEEESDKFIESIEFISQFTHKGSDEIDTIHQWLLSNGKILIEGAQGNMLNISSDNYPYVTCSATNVAGLLDGAGFPPSSIDKVIGVVKPYVTYVGDGKLADIPASKDVADAIVALGQEYGSTTGRKRHIYPFNHVEFEKALFENGVNVLAICKVDVMHSLLGRYTDSSKGFEYGDDWQYCHFHGECNIDDIVSTFKKTTASNLDDNVIISFGIYEEEMAVRNTNKIDIMENMYNMMSKIDALNQISEKV